MNTNTLFKTLLVLSFPLFISGFCFAQEEAEEETNDIQLPVPISNDLTITYIKGNTWVWTAYKQQNEKPPIINGIITLTDTTAIVIDVPWRAQQVDQLYNYCRDKMQRRIGKVVLVGHFPGRAKALTRFKDLGVLFEGSLNNRTLSNIRKIPGPDQVFSRRKDLEMDGRIFNFVAAGRILAEDHVIVNIPHDGVLYLGSLVKSPNSPVPKLKPAVLDLWESALKDSQFRFPESEIIVSSRGPLRDKRSVALTYGVISKARP